MSLAGKLFLTGLIFAVLSMIVAYATPYNERAQKLTLWAFCISGGIVVVSGLVQVWSQ